ncbi:MAG: tetratricopeptide repeat protein [Chitinophagales bacterium]
MYSQNMEDEENIAISFFNSRDFEKSEVYFNKLFEKNPVKFYSYKYKTEIALKKYDKAIATCEGFLKNDKSNVNVQFDLGQAYLKRKDSIQANRVFHNAINNAAKDQEKSMQLISKYRESRMWNFLEELILKCQLTSGRKNSYQELLAEAYLGQSKYAEAVQLVLDEVDIEPVNYMSIVVRLQNFYEVTEMMQILEKKVYTKLAKEPNSEKWNQIAMWVSMLTKDYEESIRIARAYDRRTNGGGSYVYNMAQIAANEQQYEVAIEGFYYVANLNSFNSKSGFENELQNRYKLIQREFKQDPIMQDSFERRIKIYFDKYGMGSSTAELQILYSEFLMKTKGMLTEAMRTLSDLISAPQLRSDYKARALLNLGDYKVINDEIWEAALLYGRVDKDQKDGPMGEEARYKNSRIFYYNGDFELASELLSILKSSTTELLANDALYLSVFIQDNLENDSLNQAMRAIAKTELLFFQDKNKEALSQLQMIKSQYPSTSLMDDILMIEANHNLKVKDFSKAVSLYREVIDKYKSSILADKALFEWSKIHEEYLQKNQEAMDGYLELLTRYKDSVYCTEARKRLRRLRGEKLNEDI